MHNTLLTASKHVISKTKGGNYSAMNSNGNTIMNPKARFHKTADGKIRKLKLNVKGVPAVLKTKVMKKRKAALARKKFMY